MMLLGMLARIGIISLLVEFSLAIVGGGVEATPHEFPWAVRLEGCGGALISDRHILTAAHCLIRYGANNRLAPANPANVWIHLGGHVGPHIARESDSLYFTSVKNISFPPGSNMPFLNSLKWDVAVLEIEPINFTSKIRSIKIGNEKPRIGSKVTLAGWGLLNRSKPAHALHKIDLHVSKDCGSISERFCAKHPNAHFELKDACLGDSGSPLMKWHEEDKEWHLVGIMSVGRMSFREDCDKLGGYSAYSDLSFVPIRMWLRRVLNDVSMYF